MPYLDSSWGYGVNYFADSHYHFGPDLIFTYGPLGFLDNPLHIGRHIPISLAVHALFLIALGAQLVSIWRSGRQLAAVIFCVSLALGHRIYYDYWDYGLLALGLITVVKLFRRAPGYLDLCLLPALLAVTFLLKFSAFFAMFCMLGLYIIHLLSQRSLSKGRSAWLVICILSGPLAYLAYNMSLSHLLQYAKGASQIGTGFASAMSTESAPLDLQMAALLTAFLVINLLVALARRQAFWTEAALLVFITWSAFRFQFVRGDSSHTPVFFGFSILIFACLFMGSNHVSSSSKAQPPEPLLVVSSLAFALIALNGLATRYPVLVSSNWWPKQAFADLKMLSDWKTLAFNLDHQADTLFAALPGMQFKDSILRKRVMAFPDGTPYSAKLDLQMFPIYALQDYAAYTSYLDRRGARTLAEANPPVDNIIVEWVAIDGRNMVLDTPAMSMALLSNFRLEETAPNALLLKHRSVALPISLTPIDHQPFEVGGWVQVPLRNQLVAMSIRLHQDLRGTLVTNLYCQREVYMELETKSGTVMHFRVPPDTLRSPGLINYVPQSLQGLENLWRLEPLPDRVVRVRLIGPGLEWTHSDGYYFSQIENLSISFSK